MLQFPCLDAVPYSWLYRIRPAVTHEPFKPFSEETGLLQRPFVPPFCVVTPNQLRWGPFRPGSDSSPRDFVTGLHTVAGAGDPALREGIAIHVYIANQSMKNRAMYNADGDLLIGIDLRPLSGPSVQPANSL